MENLFILNPNVSAMDISDGIFIRLTRIKAIISYLTAYQEELESDDNHIMPQVVNQIFLVLLDYCEQIDCLYVRLSRMITAKG